MVEGADTLCMCIYAHNFHGKTKYKTNINDNSSERRLYKFKYD